MRRSTCCSGSRVPSICGSSNRLLFVCVSRGKKATDYREGNNMTCSHPDIKQFTFSDGQAIQCCDSCTRFDEARKAVLQPPFRFSWNRVKPSLSVKDDPRNDEPV